MSYISNLVHYVWSTAGRQEWIDPGWQDDLYGYLGGVVRNAGGRLLSAGGMPDHVHLYLSMSATVSIAQMANLLKSNSSRWVHESAGRSEQFRWQTGYAAFTVSKSGHPALVRYIQNQSDHHRRRSFQDELRALLDKHQIQYDEQYLWG